MVSKEKLISLNKYLSSLKDKLSSPTPEKHKDHPETYKQFLEREIRAVGLKLEAAKIDGVK